MPYNIYNLTNENTGGQVITYDAGPALEVTNLGTGISLSLISGPTTSLNVVSAPVGGNTIAPAVRFMSGASAGNAVLIGRTVAGSPTVPLIFLGHLSAASAPVFEFVAGGGFVSVTSIVLTTVANFAGGVRIKVGDLFYWIPVIRDAGLVGTGAF